MIEKMVEVPTADGKMDAFVVHPDEGGPFPSVFILMDIWGLREELFDVARRVAVTGYHCILPNFWYRRGKIRFEFRNDKGQMRSLLDLPQKVQDELHDNMNLVTDPMAMADIRSVLNHLDGEPVRRGPKGSIGFCLGGRLGLAAAGHYPEDFRATASLHGTRLVNETPDSPHLLADKFKGSIYCGFAEKDHWAPPATIAAMDKLMKGRDHVRYRAVVHAGTVHGYSLPDRDIYHKQSANRDWEHIFAMFKRELN
ncbi:MAG TPA: dienelactone hydrolase family protein [Xanthobacteraceae bacterium]|nr:dienelactone hydrolase family protein [Xanthobacteraceae bacterium]